MQRMSNHNQKSISTEIAACTDVGLVCKNNEDAYLIADLNTGNQLGDVCSAAHDPEKLYMLLAVSDGMGGHLSGEIASRLTVETLCEKLPQISRKVKPHERLVQVVEQANFK